MSPVKEFGDTAKSLAKNPLGIIALFIVLIYGFASLVVGASDNLQPDERYPIVWFLVIFPVVVLGVFAWLVSKHHKKLYAPKDYKSDEAFLQVIAERQEGRPALIDLDKQIVNKVKEVLDSDELLENSADKNALGLKLQKAAEKITQEIRNASFITVDARKLTGSDKDVFELPYGVFSNLNEFTNEIYFLINHCVGPYEYGYTWVLNNPRTGNSIKNLRMIVGAPSGIQLIDKRSLKKAGIDPGVVLEVIKPK